MKKKKIKKMINKLKKKSERELDVEVGILSARINSLDTNKGVLNEKIKYMNGRINHIDERTMALDNVKVQKTFDKTKELDGKVKILMDRTSTNYVAMGQNTNPDELKECYTDEPSVTYNECFTIVKYMALRGATKDELDNIKDYFNKYIFKCRLFKITTEKEDKNDG